MKLKRKIINGLLMGGCLFHLSGCSRSTNTQAANVLNFNLNNITGITISYDKEAVTLTEIFTLARAGNHSLTAVLQDM